ncbi:MAG: hypothetical protein ACXVHQ_42075, partial [Solirubrobacteraceae bacterium]
MRAQSPASLRQRAVSARPAAWGTGALGRPAGRTRLFVRRGAVTSTIDELLAEPIDDTDADICLAARTVLAGALADLFTTRCITSNSVWGAPRSIAS